MKNSISIILIILTCQFTFSQKFSIELPDGEKEIKVNQGTIVINVYITREGKTYLEEEEVEFNTLASKLKQLSSKLPEILDFRKKIFLYIDKNADYSIVDDVKTQLSKNKVQYVYYKTGSTDDKDFLKGESAFNYSSITKYETIEKVETKMEKSEKKKGNDSLAEFLPKDMPMPPPPPAPPTTSLTFYPKFYSDKQEVVNEVLERKVAKCFRLNNKWITSDVKQKVETDKLEDMIEQLKGLNYFILYFDEDLSFKNYFKTLRFLKTQSQKLYKEKKDSFYIIEISKEMEEIHKLSKVKLCD